MLRGRRRRVSEDVNDAGVDRRLVYDAGFDRRVNDDTCCVVLRGANDTGAS
jgi:hypothetical protein